MANQEPARPDDLLNADEASALLEVAPDRVDVLVEEGLLTPRQSTRDAGGRETRSYTAVSRPPCSRESFGGWRDGVYYDALSTRSSNWAA